MLSMKEIWKPYCDLIVIISTWSVHSFTLINRMMGVHRLNHDGSSLNSGQNPGSANMSTIGFVKCLPILTPVYLFHTNTCSARNSGHFLYNPRVSSHLKIRLYYLFITEIHWFVLASIKCPCRMGNTSLPHAGKTICHIWKQVGEGISE